MISQLVDVGFWKLILALATMIGAFGGFPDPPKAFTSLTQFQIVKWMLVFTLIYQGGGGENVVLSGILTATTFVVYKLVRYFESDNSVSDDLVL